MNRESLEIANSVASFALEKKATNVVVMDVEDLISVVDAFVIASASSTTQVRAIVDNIDEKMEEKGFKLHHIEGQRGAEWVLMDYGWIVVHVFTEEERAFYNIEALWKDAEVTQIV